MANNMPNNLGAPGLPQTPSATVPGGGYDPSALAMNLPAISGMSPGYGMGNLSNSGNMSSYVPPAPAMPQQAGSIDPAQLTALANASAGQSYGSSQLQPGGGLPPSMDQLALASSSNSGLPPGLTPEQVAMTQAQPSKAPVIVGGLLALGGLIGTGFAIKYGIGRSHMKDFAKEIKALTAGEFKANRLDHITYNATDKGLKGLEEGLKGSSHPKGGKKFFQKISKQQNEENLRDFIKRYEFGAEHTDHIVAWYKNQPRATS